MKVSLQITSYAWPDGPEALRGKLVGIAQTADALGFDTLWVGDHVFQEQHVGPVDEVLLEGYTALSFMAALTQRIRLGTMVTAVSYRHPGLLVKMLSSLDILSGGRTWLGIGAGYYQREAQGLGLPFPSLKERFEQLEETLQIAMKMWSGDASPFSGVHYQLAEPINSPQPLAKPHPPILIGGTGEAKTLRLVAQYGDACNLFPLGDDVITHKLDILKHHCETLGRNYNTIECTLQVALNRSGTSTPSEIIERCRGWAALGIQHVILMNVPHIADISPIEQIGREVIPVLAEL